MEFTTVSFQLNLKEQHLNPFKNLCNRKSDHGIWELGNKDWFIRKRVGNKYCRQQGNSTNLYSPKKKILIGKKKSETAEAAMKKFISK